MLLVLGSSSLALAQQPPAGPPSSDAAPAEPAEAAPTEGAPSEQEAPSVSPEATAEAAPEAVEAAAPEVEAAPAKVQGGQSEEILVTGSRIKRSSSFAASAPVEIIDRKQLEYSGATNLADVVQYLTVAQGSGFQGGAAGAGTVAINLRGLGFAATLVLLNGRRMGPSGAGISVPFQDIGTIPLAAVERIEILKGGASSIYGSDAIGGVVNIITRKNFDGARLEADGQGTTHNFDLYGGNVSGVVGASSERGRVMLSMQYGGSNELLATKRDWTAKSTSLTQQTQGNPGSFIVGTSAVPDPDCMRAPGSTVVKSGPSQLCAYNSRNFTALIPPGERVGAFASGEFDLTHHTTLFSELLVSRTRGDSTFNTFPIAPSDHYGGTGFPAIAANHVDNPFGQPTSFIGRPFGIAQGPTYSNADEDTLRGVYGLKGDFEDAAKDTIFESWEWEVYGSIAQSRYHSLISDTLQSQIITGLNSCSDPSHLENCYNPFYSSVLGTGTPNSDSVQQKIRGTMANLTDHALQTYNAGMSGHLFELPGGDVGLAFGAEMRHEWRQSNTDHDANIFNYGLLLGNTDAVAARNVYSGYLELRWPFYDGIELQTAGRIEHYSDIDQSPPSPSAGLTITPAEIAGRDSVAPALRKLQLRGHATDAFRAPSLYDSFPGSVVVPAAIVDPQAPLPALVGIHYFGNPKLKPERALAVSGGLMWSPIDELGLIAEFWYYDYNHRIKPENYNETLSGFYGKRDAAGNTTCPSVAGLVTSGTDNHCKVTGVNAGTINTAGSLVTDGLDFGAMVNLTGATFGGAKEDFGTISFGAIGTYTITYDLPRSEMLDDAIKDGIKCDGTSPTSACHLAGVRNASAVLSPIPRWRVNFPVTWVYQGHNAAVITHFISSVVDDQAAANNPGVKVALPTLASMTTVDLQYGYTLKDVVGKELTMRVGVYNVLDTPPPFAQPGQLNNSGFDPLLHDPRGRMVYAKLISQF
ncbi:MAG: TonB-dependent receptor domain-containing protein [Polyangiales bacterium]